MNDDLRVRGELLMDEAIALMQEALRRHPEGLGATEAGRKTGLQLEVPAQQGYIAWTILQHMGEQGLAVKKSKRYHTPPAPLNQIVTQQESEED